MVELFLLQFCTERTNDLQVTQIAQTINYYLMDITEILIEETGAVPCISHASKKKIHSTKIIMKQKLTGITAHLQNS